MLRSPDSERSSVFGRDARGDSGARLLAEQNHQLYESLPGLIALSLVLAPVLVASHWQIRPPALLLGWLVAFVSVSAARVVLSRAYRSGDQSPASATKWYARYRALVAVSGLVWGASAWVFLGPAAPAHQTLMAFAIAGIGAVGAINHGARWQCAWWYLLPALVPFLVRFLMMGTPLTQVIALLIGIYIAALMTMSMHISRKTVEHIRARLEQAEQFEASRRHRQRYQSLVESTMAIIWEGDPETLAFNYVSPESEKLLGYPPERWIEDPDFWPGHIHPDDRDWAVRFCKHAVSRQEKHSFDYRMVAADGTTIWLRDVVNVIVRGGRSEKLVGVMIDISELKESRRDYEYVSGLQRLMVDVSRRLFEAGEEELDTVLSATLEKTGQWCRADRAYLIWFSPDLRHFSNTHEWVAPGIAPEMHNLQNVPSSTIPVLLETLKRKERAIVPLVAGLDERWAAEKALFEEEDIQSLICLPIFSGERLTGLIGFDSVRAQRDWSDEEAALLQALGDLIGAAMDRGEKEKQLRASESLRTHAEALAGMGSWEWPLDSERFLASSEWRNVTGCGDGPLTREQVVALTPPEERGRVLDAIRATVQSGKSYDVEHRIIRPDNGEERWVKVHGELVELGEGSKSLRGFVQDITERKAAEDKLFHLAHYDNLTGLPNRVLVLDRLEHALQRARRNNVLVGVFYLDLDQFKKVNDTLGHDAGDRVLTDAAERLVALFRGQDTVSRIGGDEFVIVLEDFRHTADITSAAGKILDAFHKPLMASGREFMLSTSIGIAVSPHDGTSAHDLMRNADTAMYHAKQKGRDAYQFFDRSMNDAVERQLALEEELRGAIDRGEMYVHYQPSIRLEDKMCVGAEALLRWRHPELGNIAPDEFIQVAEQSGLIQELGRFVVREAVAQVAVWREKFDPEFCVAVNVSPREFRDSGIAEFIIDELEKFGLGGDALEVEITEGVLMPGRPEVRDELQALRRAGIGIVMDDFGTGYASLSYLRDHPFTSLKVDRSFVGNLDTDQRHRKLVVSALRLGQALDMKVVAEGVETEGQLQVLLEEGCGLGQGFLFSRPVAPERITELLERQRSVARGS